MGYIKEKISRLLTAENAALALFALISIPLLIHHAPWRDEALHWLIARDWAGWNSFIHQLGYEGTPGLWLFAMLPFARSGLPFFVTHIINAAAVFAAVYIVLKKSPFPTAFRIMTVFGYFFLYEYNIIARSYGLSLLLVVMAAAAYRDRFESWAGYAVPVALLANTNANGTIMAIAMISIYCVESALEWVRTGRIGPGRIKGAALMVFGVAVAVLQMAQPADIAPVYKKWYWGFSAERLQYPVDSVVSAFIPVPVPFRHFWNTAAVYLLTDWHIVLAVLLFCCASAALAFCPAMLLFFLVSSGGAFALFYLRYGGFVRHYGFIYLSFLFALWAGRSYVGGWKLPDKVTNTGLAVVLSLHIIASGIACYYESRYVFSGGRETARKLMEETTSGESGVLLAAYPAFIGESVLPYLPGRMLYFLETGKYGTHITFDSRYAVSSVLDISEITRRFAVEFAKNGYRNGYLLLGRRVSSPEFLARFEPVFVSSEAIVDDETFYVYRFRG